MKQIASIIAILLLGFTSKAQQTIEKIKNEGKIVLGTTASQYPFSYKDENDSLLGIDVELARALATSINVDLEVKEIEFGKLIDELEAGNVDIVISALSMKADRNMRVAMAGPYHNSDKAFLTSKTGPRKYDQATLNQEGMTFAAIDNSTSETLITMFYPKATLVEVESIDEAVDKLMNDEITAIIADYESLDEIALGNKNWRLVFVNDIPLYDPLGIAVQANDFLFLNLVENFIEAVVGSGYINMLEKKYDLH